MLKKNRLLALCCFVPSLAIASDTTKSDLEQISQIPTVNEVAQSQSSQENVDNVADRFSNTRIAQDLKSFTLQDIEEGIKGFENLLGCRLQDCRRCIHNKRVLKIYKDELQKRMEEQEKAQHEG